MLSFLCNSSVFAFAKMKSGSIAQSVGHPTADPGVASSNPSSAI